jgi:hypothetical protein
MDHSPDPNLLRNIVIRAVYGVFPTSKRPCGLFKKVALLLLFLFTAYQIYFFTKPEIKKFYNMRGSVIF